MNAEEFFSSNFIVEAVKLRTSRKGGGERFMYLAACSDKVNCFVESTPRSMLTLICSDLNVPKNSRIQDEDTKH